MLSFLLWVSWLWFLSLLWLSTLWWSQRTALYKRCPLKQRSVVCFRAEIKECFFFWLEKLINGIFLSTVIIPTWVFFPYETICRWTRLTAGNFLNIMTIWEYLLLEVKEDIILSPSNIIIYYYSINRFCNLFLLTKDMTAYLAVTLLISRQKVTRLVSYFLNNTF